MTTNSSTAAPSEAGHVSLMSGRLARARRWNRQGMAGTVTYSDAAGRTRTAAPDAASTFVPLTAEDIDTAHGIALIEAAGHGVRVLIAIDSDQHDAAFASAAGATDSAEVVIGMGRYLLTRVLTENGEPRRLARQFAGGDRSQPDSWVPIEVLPAARHETAIVVEAAAPAAAPAANVCGCGQEFAKGFGLRVHQRTCTGRPPVEVVEPFKVGQSVEVDTRYLTIEPEQWERATVYAVGGLLGDRNIEVEYAAGGVAPVAVSRVRPVDLPVAAPRVTAYGVACCGIWPTCGGRHSPPTPPHAAGAGPAANTNRTDPQT